LAARRLLDAALPIVAVLVFVAAVVAIAGAAGSTLGYDYQAYVQAANRLLAGQPLYDPSVDVAGPFAIYLYPPPFAIAMVPFTWLPTGVGPSAWTAALALAFAAGVALLPVNRRVRWTTLLLAGLCWPFLYSIKLGQVGPLLFLAFVAGWRWLDRPVPLAAAMAVGTLVKLQPALLFGWAIATGRVRAAAIGLGLLAAAIAVATVVTGPGTWADYVAILGRVSTPVTTPHNYTAGAIAYAAGASLPVATAIQWAGVALAAIVVLYSWWRADATSGYVTTVVGSQVVSPLLWEHYAMLLLIPTALLLERRHWWAVALPLLPWLGPLAYPPVFLAGLVGPLVSGSRRRPDDAVMRPAGRGRAGDARATGDARAAGDARPAEPRVPEIG
jgi:hypothetical protein